MKQAKRLEIRGKVQGVSYRESMREEAERLGATGWVRNRGDGSVEAWVQGEVVQVEALLMWAESGPPAAEVSTVKEENVVYDPSLTSFQRRPTL